MNDNKNDFIKELNAFWLDHFEHFGFYPMDFEYENKIYEWDDFIHHIKEK